MRYDLFTEIRTQNRRVVCLIDYSSILSLWKEGQKAAKERTMLEEYRQTV